MPLFQNKLLAMKSTSQYSISQSKWSCSTVYKTHVCFLNTSHKKDTSPAIRRSYSSSLILPRPGGEVCCGKVLCRRNNPHPLLRPKLEDCPSLDGWTVECRTISTEACSKSTMHQIRLKITAWNQTPTCDFFLFFFKSFSMPNVRLHYTLINFKSCKK